MTQMQDPHYRRTMPVKRSVTNEDAASARTSILHTPVSSPWDKLRSLIGSIANARWWNPTRRRSIDATQQAAALSTWEDEGGTPASAAAKPPTSMNAE
jgi:hypothetical protein